MLITRKLNCRLFYEVNIKSWHARSYLDNINDALQSEGHRWRAGRTISNFGIYVIWCNNISWIWNTVTEKATASYHWGLNYPSAETNVTHDFKKARIDVFILYSHVSFFSRDVFTIQTSLCCFCCAFSAGRVSLCLTDFVLFWSIRTSVCLLTHKLITYTPHSLQRDSP